MDEAKLLQSVLKGVLGGRRKRGRRTMRHLVGSTSGLWSNPTVLLTAAGLAWGLIETVQARAGSFSGQPAAPPASGGATSSVPLPPLPVVASGDATGGETGAVSDGLRLVRLAISSGQADGAIGDIERAEIRRVASEQGLGEAIAAELERPRTLAEIVAGVADEAQKATLYGLAFAVIRADEQVNGAERIYLAQLAHLLGLDPATVAKLESATAARIDAADDREQAS